jgi:hypothetical protein
VTSKIFLSMFVVNVAVKSFDDVFLTVIRVVRHAAGIFCARNVKHHFIIPLPLKSGNIVIYLIS